MPTELVGRRQGPPARITFMINPKTNRTELQITNSSIRYSEKEQNKFYNKVTKLQKAGKFQESGSVLIAVLEKM